MSKSNNRSSGHADRANRRSGREVRQARRDALTAAEQIAALDARLGAGVGATRERARLASA